MHEGSISHSMQRRLRTQEQEQQLCHQSHKQHKQCLDMRAHTHFAVVKKGMNMVISSSSLTEQTLLLSLALHLPMRQHFY